RNGIDLEAVRSLHEHEHGFGFIGHRMFREVELPSGPGDEQPGDGEAGAEEPGDEDVSGEGMAGDENEEDR
ncbi:MAG: hypothetical protein LPK38_01325, partial [Actinomycetes bacterium]|nr:hypothetical protein [Actinomycetes bacterium]MDX5379953.1 hypothetical protein [Actinomycetes bacterium]MDX5398462.1 hypothetical protein [Actinomycetes bacterium]MDX5449665.1 hypothetical protein [Actinomycetes bacterium]